MEEHDGDASVERSTLIDNADDKEFIELDTKGASNGDSSANTTGLLHENRAPNGDGGHQSSTDKLAIPMSKKTILKNVFVGCTAFIFLFTAFGSISNLQTSLNREEGIGSISLSIVYASIILSCFLPKFLIARMGCKMTIAVSMIGYIFYIAANFYAIKATMFIAAVFVGFAAAPLWTAKFTYLTQSGVWYAKLTNQEKEIVINRFFGFFWLFTQSCQVWGNLVASLVFKPTHSENGTLDNPACGAAFCGGNMSGNFEQDTEKVYTALGIYVGCAIIAFLIVIIFLDPIKLDNDDGEDNKKLNPKLLLATFKHLFTSPIQMMLVVITIYGGSEKAFVQGEFTQAYISCSLGIWNLGYVMICYGVVGALCSLLFGNLVKYLGRVPFFIFLFLCHGGLQVVLLTWVPTRDEEVLFYVYAGLWGAGSMVISTQLNALYGEFFTENSEAGFSNFRLWEAVGYAVAYAYNTALCTDVKLYICMATLALGMIGYGAAEVTFRRNKKRKPDATSDTTKLESLVNNRAEE